MSISDEQKTYGLFSSNSNRKLIKEFESVGAKIIQFPTLDIEKLILDKAAVRHLQNLSDFDWIIFPDVFAVDCFLEYLEEEGIDFFELDAVRVCVLGEAVADRLRFVQLHADLIPSLIETENVFTALMNYIGPEKLRNLRFLLLKEIETDSKLSKKLIENKAIVMELPVYQAKLAKTKEILKLKVLLKGGAIDEFIFSSLTDIISLKFLFESDELAETLAGVEVSATDETVLQALREENLKTEFRRIT